MLALEMQDIITRGRFRIHSDDCSEDAMVHWGQSDERDRLMDQEEIGTWLGVAAVGYGGLWLQLQSPAPAKFGAWV